MLADRDIRTAPTPGTEGGLKYAVANTAAKLLEREIKEYQQLVGQAIYPTIRARPDIAFSAGIWARYMANPSTDHKREILRIFRYLKQFPHLGIIYHRPSATQGNASDLGLVGYADSGFDNQESNRSTTGYVFKMAGGAISWASKCQALIAQSSTEAEYYALNAAAREASWLRDFLEELGEQFIAPIKIYEDNRGARSMATSDGITHSRTKHIRRTEHYIRKEIRDKRIVVEWIPTEQMAADGLTKPLEGAKYRNFIQLLGMKDITHLQGSG
jgi:hypothetical protein